jgi:hypothetical protein
MTKENASKFDSVKYRNEWKKENMMTVRVSYSIGFVQEFKQACNSLGISQSSVFRDAMQKQ